mgnify:CR=1 FL=1
MQFVDLVAQSLDTPSPRVYPTAQSSREAFVSYDAATGQIRICFPKDGHPLALEAIKSVFGEGQGQHLYECVLARLSGA